VKLSPAASNKSSSNCCEELAKEEGEEASKIKKK
jgi:hypothetical protein